MTTAVTRHRAERIARLFMVGHTLDYVSERGVYECWTRAEAEEVVDAQGWELDASGRVPRRFRNPAAAPVATPPSAPAPAPAAAPRPAARAPQPPPATLVMPTEPVQAGGVYVAALQARDFGVDQDYQRPLDEARVARMVAAWNPRKLGTLHVSDRGSDEHPRYAVVDGKHRAAAAAKVSPLGADVWLVCNVHEGLTVAEEAQLMREIDRDTKKLSGFDRWRCRRMEGDATVRAVEEVAATHGLRVDETEGDGVIRSYGTAEKLFLLGGEQLLDQTLAVLRGAYDLAAAAYQGPLLMAVGRLLHSAAELDVVRLTRALSTRRPEQLRASAQELRDVESGPLYALMASVITTAYNRTPGSGPRLAWSY